jgi:hypothetical protein
MKKFKFTMTATLSMLLIASNVNALELNDINNHWGKETIAAAISNGYVDGYPDGAFKPDNNITRAEFITMLSKATNNVGENGQRWYDSYVNGLKKKNVVFEGDFDDYDMKMTRLELARLSLRMIRPDLQVQNVILDDKSVMVEAVKLGLVQGLSGGELGPEQNTTRAQSVTIIQRILKVLAGEKLPVDVTATHLAEVAKTGSNYKTVIGKKSATDFPQKFTYNGLTMTLLESYMIDTDALEGARRGYVTEKSLEHSWVIAYKVIWEFADGAQPTQGTGTDNYIKMLGWDQVENKSYTYGIIRPNSPKVKQTMLMFARNKDVSSVKSTQPDITIGTVNAKSYPVFLPMD